MMKNEVILTDDALIVGQTKILWDNIAVIRTQDDPLLRKISNRFPRAEIFLKGGKVVTISNLNKLQNQSSLAKDDGRDAFQFIIMAINMNTPEAVTRSNAWFEWRLLLPVLIIEIVVFFGCILTKRSVEEISLFGIAGGMLGAIVGWIWEKQARKKRFV